MKIGGACGGFLKAAVVIVGVVSGRREDVGEAAGRRYCGTT